MTAVPSGTPFGSAWRGEWLIDPSVTYLNHGTVGAPPRRVLAAQQAIRDEIERQPAQFLLRELADVDGTFTGAGGPRMRLAAERVAGFVGARADDLAFVDNITAGANAVFRSFPFAPGDEIVVSNLAYGGVVNAARYAAERAGATVRCVELPWPGAEPGAYVEAFAAGIGPRTRIVLVDHITAETALVLPLADIAAACHARGALVLADGAHAPGAIPLDITALGVDWYAANLHKWAFTPRSSGILWASPEQQPHLHPPVISWGLGNGMAAEFDLLGTRDPSPWLAAPAALDFIDELGFEAIAAYNHRLAYEGAATLAHRWGTSFTTPESMIGTMANVRLPEVLGGSAADVAALRGVLWGTHRIEIPVFAHGGRLTLRLSAQVYVGADDVDRLGDAVDQAVRDLRP
jgi:isopenicillin-N epimerase